MAGAPRGLDLTFLSAEEAQQIFQVLERDSALKRAEKDRISKLQKQNVTGLQGVTGEWFEEIQRKKFRNDVDVNRMLKRPLAHWLRKTSRNNAPNPQAQKNISSSILGFRSPFSSLFSFKKSRKHNLKHQAQQQPGYDSFALGTQTSSKVEEMAHAETCKSSSPAELPGNLFDASQAEMEYSAPVWNEQLEKELLHVLSDLDDQLAQEQVQDSVTKRHLDESGLRAQYPTPNTSRLTTTRGQPRNYCNGTANMSYSDVRTIRAKKDHNVFFQPRKFYDMYKNSNHSGSKDDHIYRDTLDSNCPVLSRKLSLVSFGESSEGSLHLSSITQSSGFGHNSYVSKGTVRKSYSVCSLQRYSSSPSYEPFSTASLQHLLATESNSGFVQRNNQQTPKRIPLSSIVWNKPHASGHASDQDCLFRTQSLTEFNATKQNIHPCYLHKNMEYEFYRSKHHYRRSVSSTNCSSSISCTDKAATPLSFENWENYPLSCLEKNFSVSQSRGTTCHGRLQMHQESSVFGRKDEHPPWSNIYQYYSDEMFLSPDGHEMITSNVNDRQSVHAKSTDLVSQCCPGDFQTRVSENKSRVPISRRASNKLVSKNLKDLESHRADMSAVTSSSIKADVSESVLVGSRVKTKLIAENNSSVTKVSQRPPQCLVTQTNLKKDFQNYSEKVRDFELPGKVDQKSIKDTLQPLSQMCPDNTIDPQISPSNNAVAAALQKGTSCFSLPLSLSLRRAQFSATKDITKNNIGTSCTRNTQRNESPLPAYSEYNQAPTLLSADESSRGCLVSSLKQWEHNLLNSAKRKGVKLGSRRADTTNHTTLKEQSFLIDVLQSGLSIHAAPITETLADHQSRSPSSRELLSPISQGSLKAFSHNSYPKSLETPTNSSVNCRVTEAPAEAGKADELARFLGKDIFKEKLQDQNILASKDHNSQLTPGGSQNRNGETNFAHDFHRGPETAEHNLNYFCLQRENRKSRQSVPCNERFHKQGSVLSHTSSRSISDSPGNSNPESPESFVIYYTLPRKSASIAGSEVSDMSISFPKNKTAVWDHVENQTSDRTAVFSFNQGDPISSGSAYASMKPVSLDGATNIKEKESPVFSDPLEKEMGKSLQKCKTVSTFTVSGDEDHIEYHELVSIYYTLPRRHSRTRCNLFPDNPEITALPLFTKKSPSPKMPHKNYEVHIGLANVDFPSILEKGRIPDSSAQTSAAPQNTQTIKVSADQESSHFSPSIEREHTSQSTSNVPKIDISLRIPLKESTLVLPDVVTSDNSLHDPASTAEWDTSAKAISTTVHNQNIDKCFSLGKEKDILHITMPLIATSSTLPKTKDPPENISHFTSVIINNSVQNRDSKNCQQYVKERGSNNQNVLPSQLDKNGSHKEKSYRASAINNNLVPSGDDESRYDTRYKERSGIQHQNILLYNDKCIGFQLGAESSRKSIDAELISDGKMLSNSPNKPFQLGAVSATKSILQPAITNIQDTKETGSPKTKQEQIPLNTQMCKDHTGLQKAVMDGDDKFSGFAQDLQLLQSAVSENKLMFNGTGDKASDTEKKKNRPSVKNEVAAIHKTKRKFSSKNVSPKPYTNDIFSQNERGTTSLEINVTRSTLCPPATQPILQMGDEDQNQNLTIDVCGSPAYKISEQHKKSQANDDSLLLNKKKTHRLPESSCSQKREVNSPKHSENEGEIMWSPTTVLQKETATRSKNSHTLGQRLENQCQSMFSRAAEANSLGNQKKISSSSSHDLLPLPFSTDKNSNEFIKDLQSNVCSQKQPLSPEECGHRQRIHESKSLKNANPRSYQPCMSRPKNQRERYFSECTYTQDSCDNHGSVSNCLPKENRNSRKFKSYSELCSSDENENWASYDERNTTYGSRRVMYPSIEFGIFGKEQQLAFLENIKRSLTEGRLWRPCLLKNPGFLRNEQSVCVKRAELLCSSSTGNKMSVDVSSPGDPVNIYGEETMVYSDLDTDTTTDDEYYLNETDKESEL